MIQLADTMFNLTNAALTHHSRTVLTTNTGKTLLLTKTPTNGLYATYLEDAERADQVEAELLAGQRETLPAQEVRALMAQGVTHIDTETFRVLAVDAGEHGVLAVKVQGKTPRVFPVQDTSMFDILSFGVPQELAQAVKLVA